jgi:hypothetical protein
MAVSRMVMIVVNVGNTPTDRELHSIRRIKISDRANTVSRQ